MSISSEDFPAKSVSVGEKMKDGTIYAGISPDTGKPMYVTPADAPLTYTFNQAQKYAAKLEAHGHKDWRAPTTEELNVLFENQAAIGGFKVTVIDGVIVASDDEAEWYWSSTRDGTGAWGQRLSDGYQDLHYRGYHSSLRCVR
jgi:hypothetical protein